MSWRTIELIKDLGRSVSELAGAYKRAKELDKIKRLLMPYIEERTGIKPLTEYEKDILERYKKLKEEPEAGYTAEDMRKLGLLQYGIDPEAIARKEKLYESLEEISPKYYPLLLPLFKKKEDVEIAKIFEPVIRKRLGDDVYESLVKLPSDMQATVLNKLWGRLFPAEIKHISGKSKKGRSVKKDRISKYEKELNELIRDSEWATNKEVYKQQFWDLLGKIKYWDEKKYREKLPSFLKQGILAGLITKKEAEEKLKGKRSKITGKNPLNFKNKSYTNFLPAF